MKDTCPWAPSTILSTLRFLFVPRRNCILLPPNTCIPSFRKSICLSHLLTTDRASLCKIGKPLSSVRHNAWNAQLVFLSLFYARHWKQRLFLSVDLPRRQMIAGASIPVVSLSYGAYFLASSTYNAIPQNVSSSFTQNSKKTLPICNSMQGHTLLCLRI